MTASSSETTPGGPETTPGGSETTPGKSETIPGNSNGNGHGEPIAPDAIDNTFEMSVKSGDHDTAVATAQRHSDDELRELILRTYPSGARRGVMSGALAKLTREELLEMFGTQCGVWGAGIEMGRRIGAAQVATSSSAN